MAEEWFPFDSGAGANNTEARWVKMARLFVHDGVALAHGTGLPYGDSTGMQFKLGACVIWGNGQYYENTATITRSVTSNSSGNPRVDLIVCGFNRTANTVSVYALVGTPAATPVAPTPTQTSAVWEVPLGKVAVANGAVTISAANVTDAREISTGVDGAGGSVVKLAENYLTSSNATICDFQNIPPTFRHLEMITSARSAKTATIVEVDLSINGIATTSYDYQELASDGSTTTSARTLNLTLGRLCAVPAASASASQIGSTVTRFFNYSQDTGSLYKQWQSHGGLDSGNTPLINLLHGTLTVANTAINRINCFEGTSAAFVAGSGCQLYGIR